MMFGTLEAGGGGALGVTVGCVEAVGDCRGNVDGEGV